MSDAARFAHRLTTAIFAGMLCGAVVGGIGGRIAMFVLRLTSDDNIRGLDTDDGFEIGSITGSTAFLVIFTTLLGAACGVGYLATRRFVPDRFRAVASAVLFGSLGGAVILKPGEFDFTHVEPAVLSVALFLALPAAFGAVLSIVAERRLANPPERPRPWYALLPLVVLGLTGPFGLGFLMLTALGYAAFHNAPTIQRAWQSDSATWAGRVVLAAVVAMLAVDAIGDAASIV